MRKLYDSKIVASIAAAGLVGLPQVVWAGIVPVPAGLSPGQPYRLAFVTSETYSAVSSSESVYNGFVNADATLNSSLAGITWYAIVSAGSTSAASNISCVGCANLPIYDLDGNEIASSQASLFSESLLYPLEIDESGAMGGTYVWTGSNADGTSFVGATLGEGDPEIGTPGTDLGYWLAWQTAGNTEDLSLYAISGALTAPGPAVPEPGTIGLLATGFAALAGLHRRRERARSLH
jgi:hypothetical protein